VDFCVKSQIRALLLAPSAALAGGVPTCCGHALVEAALANQRSADKFALCACCAITGKRKSKLFCDRTSQKVLDLAIASREGADPLRPSSCDNDRRLAVAVA
jgi:hypothetical protein